MWLSQRISLQEGSAEKDGGELGAGCMQGRLMEAGWECSWILGGFATGPIRGLYTGRRWSESLEVTRRVPGEFSNQSRAASSVGSCPALVYTGPETPGVSPRVYSLSTGVERESH